MRKKRFMPFEITGMDSLGQGVSKLSEKVTFIPKTTIGDKGEAEIMSEKKGVIFARVKRLDAASSDRIEPTCVHFQACSSCHYQHVSYEQELLFKKENFQRLFRKLPLPEVEVIGAPERYHYRNRIQLHYSLKSKLIGMRDPQTFEITPIPHCLIGVSPILDELKKLYQDNHWSKLAPPAPAEGHVELYWINDEVKLTWNRPYAEGGFTQVNDLMNQKLKKILTETLNKQAIDGLLDLFGGNGNLSGTVTHQGRLCVDMYRKIPGEHFMHQDLYEKEALKNVVKEVRLRSLNISHLILDPPRSGLKEFSFWLEAFKPQFAAYVSCDPHTLARDLATVEGYRITRAFLIDFFPSTFHFESMIFLERKS
jgi:23S rRNA (uracil1939-C5)-methyltransferase